MWCTKSGVTPWQAQPEQSYKTRKDKKRITAE
jgi:hypothetical protein